MGLLVASRGWMKMLRLYGRTSIKIDGKNSDAARISNLCAGSSIAAAHSVEVKLRIDSLTQWLPSTSHTMSNNSPSNLFDAPTNVKILHQKCLRSDWPVVYGGVFVRRKLLFVCRCFTRISCWLKQGGVTGSGLWAGGLSS